MATEAATHDYVPAAMRPYTHQIAPGVSRVRFTRAGVGARYWMVVMGVIVGELLEGRASAIYLARGQAPQLYASVEAVDAAVAQEARR